MDEHQVSFSYRHQPEGQSEKKQYPTWLFVAVNAVIALLLIATLTFLLLLFSDRQWLLEGMGEDVEIEYVLEFYDINGVIEALPLDGAELTDAENGKLLGRITAVSSRPYTVNAVQWQEEWEALPEGIAPQPQPEVGRIVSVTVKTAAQYRPSMGYFVKGVRVAGGDRYNVCFAGAVAQGLCVRLCAPVNNDQE